MDEYYIVASGVEDAGPFSLAELNARAQAGQIGANTQIRCPGGFVVPATMVSGLEGINRNQDQKLPEYVPPIPVKVMQPKVAVTGFNLGALCLTWIWGIYHRAVLTLIVLVLDVAFVATLWLAIVQVLAPDAFGLVFSARMVGMVWVGVQGNAWAWQSGRYETVEQMKAAQKKWGWTGAIICGIIGVVLVALAMIGVAIITRNLGLNLSGGGE